MKKKLEELYIESKELADKLVLSNKELADGLSADNKELADGLSADNKELADGLSAENKELADGLSAENKESAEKLVSRNKKLAEKLIISNKELADGLSAENKEFTDGISTINEEFADKLSTINEEYADKLGTKNKKLAEKLVITNKELADELNITSIELADKLIIANKEFADGLSAENKELAYKLVIANKKLAEKLVIANKEIADELRAENKELADKLNTINKKLKLVEEKLHQSQKMDAIGQLAGGMAHDFNNVLNGILGASELLRSPTLGLNEKSLKYVEMIIQATKRASDLISKLMAFSHKGKISRTTLDIHQILNDIVTILEGTIDKKIIITLIKDAHNHNFIGDLSAIESAFINLGINASHAMPNGGELQITTKNIFLNQKDCDFGAFEIVPGNYLEIDVKDTGCGIPEENLQKIFEPFFTTKEQGSGTGLGLSAVYGTIQNHHGMVDVSSEVGVGTTFSILLPNIEDSIKQVNQLSPIQTGEGTILLVDDEELNRIVNKEILESLGYEVILAEDGLESVEIFDKLHSEIDIVLMDMVMPKMNGSEAFYKMKKIDENCKVIILSGYTKDMNIDDLIKNGLAGFIDKPFNISQISQLLNNCIDR